MQGLQLVHCVEWWVHKLMLQPLVDIQGTGFPLPERERLGIRGLLPPGTLTMERQVQSSAKSTSKPVPRVSPSAHMLGLGLHERYADAML